VTAPSVAVDAGQTEVRAVLVDGYGPAGDVVEPASAAERVDGPMIGLVGPVATAPGVERMDGAGVDADAVAAALLAAVGRLELPVSATATVAIGLSGFEAARPDDLGRIEALLRARLSVGRVVIASDGVTSLLGALGERPGAVVAAGTGTIVVARGRAGWARVDGWGSLLGDAGSGFAIGRAGLDAALRELDGRGGSAKLLRAAWERFASGPARGAPLPGAAEAAARVAAEDRGASLPGAAGDGARVAAEDVGAALVAGVHRTAVPTRAVAGFAEVVGRLAGTGDATSMSILAEAGRELALSACTALDRALARDEPATVSYSGNVFKAGQPLLEPFARALAERRPDARLVAPAGDGLAGAAALARDPDAVAVQSGLSWRAA
jgi:N-acetylglucosamine kinase-like BadF-type ATPase